MSSQKCSTCGHEKDQHFFTVGQRSDYENSNNFCKVCDCKQFTIIIRLGYNIK
jgi:hypothetical protein